MPVCNVSQHDVHHNVTLQNDTQHKDFQHNDTCQSDTQHNANLLNDFHEAQRA